MPNEINFRTKIKSKQNWNDTEIDFDPDASPIAWEHYMKMYDFDFGKKI